MGFLMYKTLIYFSTSKFMLSFKKHDNLFEYISIFSKPDKIHGPMINFQFNAKPQHSQYQRFDLIRLLSN